MPDYAVRRAWAGATSCLNGPLKWSAVSEARRHRDSAGAGAPFRAISNTHRQSRRCKVVLLLFRLIVLAAFVISVAFGQAAAINAEITGIVLDPSGASVSERNRSRGEHWDGIRADCDDNIRGSYRLPVLPLGEYSLTVEADGFAPYTRNGIALSAGATATIDVTLQLSSVTTEVVVSSAAPIVDVARTDQGSTLSSNAVANLPLVSRNPLNFILQQPNVSGRCEHRVRCSSEAECQRVQRPD